MNKIISMNQINKIVKDGDGELSILKDLSLEVSEGELIAIVGKSGSGKTTLLNIISLIDDLYTGSYELAGSIMSDKPSKELFRYRTELIANVFQNFQLINDLTVIQNVEMPLGYRGIGRKEREEVARAAIEMVGLAGREDSSVYNLSGGEQQRVSVARAIAMKPKILLADEPTGNLDENTSREIIELITKINREQKMTTLIVTHDLDIARICDRTYLLEGGKLHEK